MNNDKYVVITGASSGIGFAVAKAFAQLKKNLILVARREENLEELKSEIISAQPDLNIVIKSVDLAQEKNLYELFDELNEYNIETWINNAGFGIYSLLANQDIENTVKMLKLNVEAVTILSMLFVKKYQNIADTQLINVSSAGGYTIVPTAVAYCGSKFFVSSFTEGLAQELIATGAKMRAKVFAPAATKTEFGKVANDVTDYDYDAAFSRYNSSEEIAEFLIQLYQSEQTIGLVNRKTFEFEMRNPIFDYAGDPAENQKIN